MTGPIPRHPLDPGGFEVTNFIASCLLVIGLTLCLPAQDEVVAKARKLMEAKQFSEAVSVLEDAYDTVKTDRVAMEVLTDAAVSAGMFDRAVGYAPKLVDLDPEHEAGHRLGALAYYWRAEEVKQGQGATPGRVNGFFEESAGFNRVYLKKKPDDIEMWSLLGHTLYWLEEHADSAKAFGRCAALDDSVVDYHAYKARAHRLGGELAEAAKAIGRAVAIDPGNSVLHKQRGDIIGSGGTKDAFSRAAKAYADALQAKSLDAQTAGQCASNIWNILAADEKWDEAIGYMEAWAKAHPKDAIPLWWTGWYRTKKGEEQAAIADFTRAWNRADQNYAQAASEIANSYSRLGMPGGAASKIDMKSYGEAIAWLCKAHAVQPSNWGNPNNEPITRVVGVFVHLANNGKLDEGAKLLENVALKVAPNDWRLLNNLGLYYRDKGGMQRGSAGKSLCRKSAGYYQRACESILKDTVATGPEKAFVLNDTGVLFHFPQYQIRDMEKGIGYYRQALTYDPEFKDANENMGICMNALGKYEEAIPFFDRVLKVEPTRRVSLSGLRRAKANLKDE